MSVEPLIRCADVTKTFRLPEGGEQSVRGRLLHPFQRARMREFDAVSGVNLEVARGEFVGIVGRNGSGKSTLLKLLAGIYHPSHGTIDVHGTIAPFIELGVGFNPDLSARDNLVLNGVLLGLTRKELRRRYDTIVDFAELHDFMDLKLRNFSSGMQVRLAFGIALQSGADILLIDEVLAVGDERFQRKCYETFAERRTAGQTVVFVSHDMGAVTRFCDRALLLEQGVVDVEGSPRRVSLRYYDLNFGGVDSAPGPHQLEEADMDQIRSDLPDVQLLGVRGEFDEDDEDDAPEGVAPGDPIDVFRQGQTVALVVETRTNAVVEDATVSLLVTDDRGNVIIALDNHGSSAAVSGIPGRTTTLRYRFKNFLAEGWYWVRVRTQDRGGNGVYDHDDESTLR